MRMTTRVMFSKILKTLGLIFYKTPEVEITVTDSFNTSDYDEEDEREVLPDGGTQENDEYIEAGERSERWYNRIERKVQENTNQTQENNNLLTVVDFRTIWIARLLLGILGSVMSYIIAQQILFPT